MDKDNCYMRINLLTLFYKPYYSCKFVSSRNYSLSHNCLIGKSSTSYEDLLDILETWWIQQLNKYDLSAQKSWFFSRSKEQNRVSREQGQESEWPSVLALPWPFLWGGKRPRKGHHNRGSRGKPDENKNAKQIKSEMRDQNLTRFNNDKVCLTSCLVG